MDTLPSQKIKWLKKNQKSKSKGRHITWLSWALSSSSAWVSVLPYVKKKNGEGGYFKKLPSHLVSLFLQRKGQWEKLILVWNPQRRLWAHVWSSCPISGPLRHGGALSGWPSAGWVARHVRHVLLPAGHSQNPRSLATWQRSPAVSDFRQCSGPPEGPEVRRGRHAPLSGVSLDEGAGSPGPGTPWGGGTGAVQVPPSKGSSTPGRDPPWRGRRSRYLRSCRAASCFLWVEAPSSLPWAQAPPYQTLETEQLNARTWRTRSLPWAPWPETHGLA